MAAVLKTLIAGTLASALMMDPSVVVGADNTPAASFECYGFEQTEGANRAEKIQSILHSIQANGFKPALLSHTGGGPNGSHFNFSGLREGLLCVLKVPEPTQEITRVEVNVGRRKIIATPGTTSLRNGGTLVSVEVPFEMVEHSSRRIRPADLGRLYHDKLETIAAYRTTGKWEGVAAPNQGQCVNISFTAHTREGKIFRGDGLAHVNCCGE